MSISDGVGHDEVCTALVKKQLGKAWRPQLKEERPWNPRYVCLDEGVPDFSSMATEAAHRALASAGVHPCG